VLHREQAWDGDSWQSYCNELLALHHPDAYQVIPAADRGDCGLEGHSTDGQGCAYQCYAPDAEINIPERRGRHVAKMTATITTLIEQRDRLGRVIGRYTVARLIFLVPRHDSADVNAHLRKQEQRLRDAVTQHTIECISPEVVLAVWTVPPYLQAEAAELERFGAMRVPLPGVSVEQADLEQYREEAAEQLASSRDKLARRFGERTAPALLDLALEDLLIGTEQERELTQRPESYERYERLKRRERRDITRRSAEGSTADRSLQDTIERLRTQMEKEVPGVHSDDAATLAAGAVSSWLIECPLDFPQEKS
jgi:hypothetical protein